MHGHLKVWRVAIAALLVAATLGGAAGCANMNNTAKGGIIGGAAGGVIGGVIGKHNGSTAKGAIIGAVVGGAAGALIGAQMDKQARELEVDIPGATVERVGEGILVTFASGLLFDFDSDRIGSTTGRNLDELANSLEKYPKSNLMIIGHTDAIGSQSYNEDLSERRADATARYLGGSGVSRSRIGTRGLGESEPVASNETESGRARNRRVEVAIYASQAWREEAEKQVAAR